MSFASARQTMIRTRGRPMTLSRLTGSMASGGITTANLSLMGFFAMYKPQDVQGDVRQGDALVSILNDEISLAGWETPKARDQMQIDGNTWFVKGTTPIYDGSTCIGHTLWVRGGAG